MIFKKKSAYDWLVAGLGNPGLQYEKTRHNIGFAAVDMLAESEHFDFGKNKYKSLVGEFQAAGQRILVLKPQTFMNNSGQAVSEAAAFYKIPTDRIIVLHDDISLPVGKIRVRTKGSDGGQKGMRDIIELMGTDAITRIKIGVGEKPSPDYDLVSWVLGKFSKEDADTLASALKRAVAALLEIISNGADSAMNKYNNGNG